MKPCKRCGRYRGKPDYCRDCATFYKRRARMKGHASFSWKGMRDARRAAGLDFKVATAGAPKLPSPTYSIRSR